jgi:periplasmic divalent cation tolerance protein
MWLKRLSSLFTRESRTDFRVALVTVPNSDVAEKIATTLLRKRLCACVNIIPSVKSIFIWENKIDQSDELLLKIKTKASLMPMLIETVQQNHPYKVPEIISIPIEEGNLSYLEWMNSILVEPSQQNHLSLSTKQ